jgi:hypothetical protein
VTQSLKQDKEEESEDDIDKLLKGDDGGELSDIIEMNNPSPIEKKHTKYMSQASIISKDNPLAKFLL